MKLNFLSRDRHAKWQQDLDAYVDGELAAARIATFEAHLAECQPCEAAVEHARFAKTAIAALPVLQAPRSFAITEAMVARGAAPRRASPGPVYRLAQATVFAALAGFATLVIVDVTSDSSADTAALAVPGVGIAETAPKDGDPVADATGPDDDGGTAPLAADQGTPTEDVGATGATNGYDAGSDDEADGSQRTTAATDQAAPQDDAPVPPLALVAEDGDDDGPGGLRLVQAALGVLALTMGATWFVLHRRQRSV